jgi:hypothetical protein
LAIAGRLKIRTGRRDSYRTAVTPPKMPAQALHPVNNSMLLACPLFLLDSLWAVPNAKCGQSVAFFRQLILDFQKRRSVRPGCVMSRLGGLYFRQATFKQRNLLFYLCLIHHDGQRKRRIPYTSESLFLRPSF